MATVVRLYCSVENYRFSVRLINEHRYGVYTRHRCWNAILVFTQYTTCWYALMAFTVQPQEWSPWLLEKVLMLLWLLYGTWVTVFIGYWIANAKMPSWHLYCTQNVDMPFWPSMCAPTRVQSSVVRVRLPRKTEAWLGHVVRGCSKMCDVTTRMMS